MRFWLGASLLCGHLVWRHTRSAAWSLFALAATFGEKDPNYAEGPRMKRLFGDRMELFEFRGGHQWAPKETVEEALDSIDARLPK